MPDKRLQITLLRAAPPALAAAEIRPSHNQRSILPRPRRPAKRVAGERQPLAAGRQVDHAVPGVWALSGEEPRLE